MILEQTKRDRKRERIFFISNRNLKIKTENKIFVSFSFCKLLLFCVEIEIEQNRTESNKNLENLTKKNFEESMNQWNYQWPSSIMMIYDDSYVLYSLFNIYIYIY